MIPVFVFVNDEGLYADMRASFESAGFSDVTALRVGEPYATITDLGKRAEPVVILCHQDVRCDQGHGAVDLAARVDELTAIDPNWSVAGTAGNTHRGDGANPQTSGPQQVASLDEHLLILRTARQPRCTASLSGWHLYGTDIVLNAEATGGTAYVVGFRVTHKNTGNLVGYQDSERHFVAHWQRRFVARYLRTTTNLVFLSRYRLLRAVLGHPHTMWRLNRRFRRRNPEFFDPE